MRVFVVCGLLLSSSVVHADVLDPATPITQCGELAAAGTYTISINLGTTSENCFNITSSNVVLTSTTTVTINGNISNIGYPVTLQGFVINNGTVLGDTLLKEHASNTGNISGGVEAFYPVQTPISGSIGGYISYHAYPTFPLVVSSFPTSGLQAYWKLNEATSSIASGGGDFFDSSGNGKNATASGSPMYGALSDYGGSGAIKLNGVSSYVLSPQLTSSSNITLSAWIKPTSLGGVVFSELGQSTINTIWHDSQIEVETDGTVKIGVWSGSPRFISIGHVNFDSWHHVVLTYNASTNTLTGYVDGVQGGSGTYVRQAPSGSVYYGIGAIDDTNAGNGNYFSGSIADVGIWNRALSSSEVSQLFASYSMSTLYFSGSSDGDWSNLSNWWQDANFTIPALHIPVSGDLAKLYATVSSITNSDAVVGTAIFNNANFESDLILSGSAIFKGTSENAGIIDGNTTFEDTASNSGVINGNADVYYSAENPLGGTVSGTITYHGYTRTLYYFVPSNAANYSWNNLGNWWNDANHTIHAESFPTNGDTVYIDGSIYTAPATSLNLAHVIVGSLTTEKIDAKLTGISSSFDFYNASSNYFDSIYGNAVFHDASSNSGTINGDATYTSSSYDSNQIYGANPQIGTVTGSTTFSSLTPITFTLRNSERWNADVTSWHFATPGTSWIFKDTSSLSAGGVIGTANFFDNSDMSAGSASLCNFYENSTYSAGVGCSSVVYKKPLYFNNASSTLWNDLGNWWSDAGFTQHASSLPTNGDIVYIEASLTQGPSQPVNLNKIYVGQDVVWTPHAIQDFSGFISQISSSADGSRLVMVEPRDGYIWISNDYGTTWTRQDGPGDQNWQSVAISADGNYIVAASYGYYLYTYNFSEGIWRTRGSSRGWQAVTSSADGSIMYAAAYGGHIFKSTNYGVNWTELLSTPTEGWQSITTSADGSIVLAGPIYGNLYVSQDSGTTWTSKDSLGVKEWYSLTSSADGTKLAAATYYDSIYLSSDSGTTWTKSDNAGTRPWQVISSSGDGSKLVAGTDRGYLYISDNYGQTWRQQPGTLGLSWWTIASSYDGTKVVAAPFYSGNIYTATIPNFAANFSGASGDAYFYANTTNTGTINGTMHIYGNRLLTDVNHGTILGGVEFNDLTTNDTTVPGDATFNGINENRGLILGGGVNYGILSGNGTTTGALTNFGEIVSGTFLGQVTNATGSVGITGAVNNLTAMIFNGGSRVSGTASLSGDAIFNATSSNWGIVSGTSTFKGYSYNVGTTTNATFVGDFAENFYLSTNGVVSGIKTRLYDAANTQVNLLRNFADSAWTVVADNTIVKLLYRNLVDLFGRNQNTTTILVKENNGFFLKPLDPGVVTTCGVLDTPNATYTLGADISNYKYDTCFVVRANGVTLDGAGHTVSAVSRNTSLYAVVATSTYSQDATYNAFTDLTIKNITFTNFAYGVIANGGNNTSGAGGNGGNVTIATSTINASVFVNGGNGTGNGGNAGTIIINYSDVRGIGTTTVLSANGGDSISCGNGGNAGTVTTINSGYDTISVNGGKGSSTTCKRTTKTQGSLGSYSTTGGNVTPFEQQQALLLEAKAHAVSKKTVGKELPQAPGLTNIVKVLPPVIPLNPLKLLTLPTFSIDGGHDNFSFGSLINNFLEAPVLNNTFTKITSPKLAAYLNHFGINAAQQVASMKAKPKLLPTTDENIPGLFKVFVHEKPLFTFLTYSDSNKIAELVKVNPGSEITIALTSVNNPASSQIVFNDKVVTLVNSKATITAPNEPGTYSITSADSPLELLVKVNTTSLTHILNVVPKNFVDTVTSWVSGLFKW